MPAPAIALVSFYEVTAQLCFVLLGIWWIVVQLRHDEFTSAPHLRILAYQVSLTFVLPGIMSLAALLALENTILWRSGFAVSGAIGAGHTIYVIATPTLNRAGHRSLQAGRWLMAAAYLLITALALRPSLPKDVGINASGLAAEGTIVALFIFLGVHLAWMYFMHPPSERI